MARQAKLGSGARFVALQNQLARRKGSGRVSNPAALAAFIGRKKYGKKRFAKLSSKHKVHPHPHGGK